MPIFNERKKRNSKSTELRINWGRGRLSGFESAFGFAAKFCRLNHLTPRQFRAFWVSLFAQIGDISFESRSEIISRVLNEPLYLVKSVFEINPVNTEWPKFDRNVFEFHPKKIKYCSLCLADGYHACFHEKEWLRKCPIHRIELEYKDISYSSGARVDHYLNILISLFDLHCPGWELSQGKYRQDDQIKENKFFFNFLYWSIFNELYLTKKIEFWFASIGCNSFTNYPASLSRSDYFLIMEKIGLIKPIPNDVHNLFANTGLSSDLIEIQKFSYSIRDELRKSLIYFHDDLLTFFRLAKIVSGEFLLFEETIYSVIDVLNQQHPLHTCDCIWGINKRNELVNCLPGELKYYGDCMCPYEFAVQELSTRWLNMSQSINILPIDIYDTYSALVQQAKFSDIVIEIGFALKNRIPIFKFVWSEETNYLLNVILQKVVLAHIEELKFWLFSIESGNSPAERERFLPNIYLVQNERIGLQLISWSAGKEHRQLN